MLSFLEHCALDQQVILEDTATKAMSELQLQLVKVELLALNIAFFGGSIMGLTVAAMGLVGIGILFYNFGGDLKQIRTMKDLLWAPISCLIFRVGGGIFTRVLRRSLVGKVRQEYQRMIKKPWSDSG